MDGFVDTAIEEGTVVEEGTALPFVVEKEVTMVELVKTSYLPVASTPLDERGFLEPQEECRRIWQTKSKAVEGCQNRQGAQPRKPCMRCKCVEAVIAQPLHEGLNAHITRGS